MMMRFGFFLAVLWCLFSSVLSKCSKGCELALASYYLSPGDSISLVAGYLTSTVNDIMSVNPRIKNPNSIDMNTRINVPFSCECIEGSFLGHAFSYQVKSGDTYTSIAESNYANLTSASWIKRFSGSTSFSRAGGNPNVIVNCSCGNSSVSKDFGLFITYPLRSTDSLSSISQQTNVSASLLQNYNPGVDFNTGSGLVYIPGKDRNGSYRPLISGSSSDGKQGGSSGGSKSSGTSPVVIVAVCAAVGLIALLGCFYVGYVLIKKRKEASISNNKSAIQLIQPDSKGQHGSITVTPGLTVYKSVEFTYAELANATNNFDLTHKIGQGGFGAVYYGELRGEKTAIKKMDMLATKAFIAELKVLSHIHHLNLVRLIGYCVENSLFLVYEYIETGDLSQHLHGSGKAALPWTTRVQIALDSARGLEYIHEHTVPVYIHRDIKSANILINSKFRAKVADFGLTKLVEVGNVSRPTGLQGTFGYMPPEYANFGEVSSKVDVYAFGVVLYELISGKKAVVQEKGSSSEPKALTSLFKTVLNSANSTAICELVDPRLGEDYPLDSVLKMAELARSCTQENPELRPTMRSAVVDLLALTSATGNWDIRGLYEHGLQNRVSGR